MNLLLLIYCEFNMFLIVAQHLTKLIVVTNVVIFIALIPSVDFVIVIRSCICGEG